jgi:hypothetical protein
MGEIVDLVVGAIDLAPDAGVSTSAATFVFEDGARNVFITLQTLIEMTVDHEGSLC